MWTQLLYAALAIPVAFTIVFVPPMISDWRMYRDPWAFLREKPKPRLRRDSRG